MGQIFKTDNIPAIVKASSTTCTLATTSGGQPTRVTVGGQQYSINSTLTLNLATIGANGFDSGSFPAVTTLYIYVIINQSSGALALIASQNAPSIGPVMPTGYGTAFKFVGAAYTDSSTTIGSMVSIVGDASTEFMSFTPTLVSGFTGGTLTGRWRRQGDTMIGYASLVSPTTWTASNLEIKAIPGSLTMDFAKLSVAAPSERVPIGNAIYVDDSAPTRFLGNVCPGTTTTGVRFWTTGNIDVWAPGAGRPVTGQNAADAVHFEFSVPITGWTATLL